LPVGPGQTAGADRLTAPAAAGNTSAATGQTRHPAAPTRKRPSTAGHTATPAPPRNPTALAAPATPPSPPAPAAAGSAAPSRASHIREHPRREQRLPVLSQERKHAPSRDQLPARLPHIQPGRLCGPLTLHASNTARQLPSKARTYKIFSGL